MSPLALLALHIAAAPIAITDVRIEVGDGTSIAKGNVIVDNGKIVAVGAAAAVPAGAERIDGRDKVVTPGLIATGSQLGVIEVSLERFTVDARVDDRVWGTSVPAFRAIDGFNPLSPRIAVDREQGVTSVVVTPWGQLIQGQGFVVDTSGTLASASANNATRAAMFASLNGWGAREAGGGARGGVWLRLREIFDDVRFYQRNKAAFDRAGARELSMPRVHLDAMIDVVTGKLPLVVEVDRASDIQALLAFAAEQKIRVIIEGGAEAWLVADDIAKAKVPVLLQPSTMEPASFDMLRARDDVAALLHKAGVTVVISAGATDNGTTRVRQEAGIAVSYGLPYAAAIEAITRAPARVFGVDNNIGTIAVGKRADLVMWSSDPLETHALSELVLIKGEKMSLSTRQKELAAKYRRR